MAAIKLSGSVGIGGNNKPADILAIQKALNARLKLIPPTTKLKEDSDLGKKPENSKTVAAIKLFQRKVCQMSKPDGLISVNGKTHKKLNETGELKKIVTEVLTFPGTKFTHGRTKKTLDECLATLPAEMRSDFKKDISHIIKEMHKLGFAFGTIKKHKAGYRTFEDQHTIPPKQTKAGPGESFHNYGLAADLGVIEWVDSSGKSHSDFWLGTMDSMKEYKGFSGKIWAKRNSFGGANVHDLSWEIIHLQGVSADTSGRGALVKCLNKAAAGSGFSYQKGTGKTYQCKVSASANWVSIGTAKEIWSGSIKNVNATDKATITSHMQAAEGIAKTIQL